MHIWTRQSHIAQAFRAEFPLVLGIACHCPQPVITGRIGPFAVLVIQAGIVKACFWKGHVSRADIVGQIQAIMAMRTFELLAEEERLAPLRGWGQRRLVAMQRVVVGTVEGQQRALEGCNRLRDRGECDRALRLGEGDTEQARIAGIIREPGEKHLFLAAHAQLDRLVAEHRDQHLLFQSGELWIGPGVARQIGYVRQWHRRA